jgi:hypothetical protein
MLFCALASSCAPEDKCSGELVYDPIGVCRRCPMGAAFKDGTCKCKAGAEYVDFKCVAKGGPMMEPSDAGADARGEEDAGAPPAAAVSCSDYCTFATSCIGENMLATAALPDIVTGLHADDKAECRENCQSDLGNDGSSDPVVACIEAGREAADCAGKSTQQSLASGLMLVGNCCRPHKDNMLCKSICATFKANPLTASMVDFCD